MKSKVCNTNADTGDELLARGLETVAPHEETWTSTQMNNTRSLHTRCELCWGWRWDFRRFIVNC